MSSIEEELSNIGVDWEINYLDDTEDYRYIVELRKEEVSLKVSIPESYPSEPPSFEICDTVMRSVDEEMQNRMRVAINQTRLSMIGQLMVKQVLDSVWNQTKAVVTEPLQKSIIQTEKPTGPIRKRKKKVKYKMLACSFDGGQVSRDSLESVLKKEDEAKMLQKKNEARQKETIKNPQSSKRDAKAPSMRTAHDVITRLKWDDQLKNEEFIIGYLDRFSGIVESPLWDLNWDDDIAATGPNDKLAIPQHRIAHFKWQSKIIWEKKNRIDHVFGSTGSKADIVKFIQRHKSAQSAQKSMEPNAPAGDKVQENSDALSELQVAHHKMDSNSHANNEQHAEMHTDTKDVCTTQEAPLHVVKMDGSNVVTKPVDPPLDKDGGCGASDLKKPATVENEPIQKISDSDIVNEDLKSITKTNEQSVGEDLQLQVSGIDSDFKGMTIQAQDMVAQIQDENMAVNTEYESPKQGHDVSDFNKDEASKNDDVHALSDETKETRAATNPSMEAKLENYSQDKCDDSSQEIDFTKSTTDSEQSFSENDDLPQFSEEFFDDGKEKVDPVNADAEGRTCPKDHRNGNGHHDRYPRQPYQSSSNVTRKRDRSRGNRDHRDEYNKDKVMKYDTEEKNYAGMPRQRYCIAVDLDRAMNKIQKLQSKIIRDNKSKGPIVQESFPFINMATMAFESMEEKHEFENVLKSACHEIQQFYSDMQKVELRGRDFVAPIVRRSFDLLVEKLPERLMQQCNFKCDPHIPLATFYDSTESLGPLHLPMWSTRFHIESLYLWNLDGGDYQDFRKIYLKKYDKRRQEGNRRGDSSNDFKWRQNRDSSEVVKDGKWEITVSKTLSAVLRHNAMGLQIDDEGYIEVNVLLKHKFFQSRLVTEADIEHLVENNAKKRFMLDGARGNYKIRAVQGHTVQGVDLHMRVIEDPAEFPTVIHGTSFNYWSQIEAEGLKRMRRNHIHMTTGLPREPNDVISGMRSSSNCYIYIDIEKAMKDGIKFLVSENGVILTEGHDGVLHPKFFKKVVHRQGGRYDDVPLQRDRHEPPPGGRSHTVKRNKESSSSSSNKGKNKSKA